MFFLSLTLLFLMSNNSCFKAPRLVYTCTHIHIHTLSHTVTQHNKLTVKWRAIVLFCKIHTKFIVLVIVVFVDIYYYRIVVVVVVRIAGACSAHLGALDVPTFIKITTLVFVV